MEKVDVTVIGAGVVGLSASPVSAMVMDDRSNHPRPPGGHYTSFAALLVILFIIRGLILLSVYPPLEGCDEHRHLGYLAFVSETRSIPVYGQSFIPPVLYRHLQDNPHSCYGAGELKTLGGLDYLEYWRGSPARETAAADPVPLKAAFHPPGYYFLAAPLFRFGLAHLGFLETVYLLRLLNILLAALALGFFLAALRPFCQASPAGYLTALALSLLPMFLVYVSRVSNNALSLLVIGAVFYLLARVPRSRHFPLSSLLVGALLGSGVWIRVDIMPFVPVALLFGVWLMISRQLRPGRGLGGLAVMLAVAAAVSYGVFAWNRAHYSCLFPSQEMFRIAGDAPIPWSWQLGRRIVVDLLLQRILVGNLWSSGWSFLHLPRVFNAAYGIFLALLILSVPAFLVRLSRRGPATEWNLPLLCLLSSFAVGAGALLHALLSAQANAGVVSTPAYYAVPGYLPFLGLALFSTRWLPRRVQQVLLAALIALFLAAEWYGTFGLGVPFWTQAGSAGEAISRLRAVHPGFPSPVWLPLFAAFYAAVGLAVVRLIRQVCRFGNSGHSS